MALLIPTRILAVTLFLLVFAGSFSAMVYAPTQPLHLQHSIITWSKTYMGPGLGSGSSIAQTLDGGYFVAGVERVVKLNRLGNVDWQLSFPEGSCVALADEVQQTFDGGYMVAGFICTHSYTGWWFVKLGSSGNVVWQKTYFCSCRYNSSGFLLSAQQTSDGGYVAAGYANDAVANGFGVASGWIMKLDPDGNIMWQKVFGVPVQLLESSTESWTQFYSIQQTTDNGYVVTGATKSFGNHGVHVWVLRLDRTGNIIWQNVYGASNLGIDFPDAVRQTSDGGFIVAGLTRSFGPGGSAWVLKLDSAGNLLWQKSYTSGMPFLDEAFSVDEASDGGYVIAGMYDYGAAGMVIKLDTSGNIIWHRAIGTQWGGIISVIRRASDGGYVISGRNSTILAGLGQLWVAKLDPNGLCCNTIIQTDPVFNPTARNTTATVTPTNTYPVSSNATTVTTTIVPTSATAIVTTQCKPFHVHQQVRDLLLIALPAVSDAYKPPLVALIASDREQIILN